MTVIVGIDPSLTGTGIVALDLDEADPLANADIRTVTSKGAADATLKQRRVRLNILRTDITAPITLCRRTALVVIEQPAYSRTVGSQHDRSGLWWLIVDEVLSCSIPVVEVAPTARARYATGRGNAGKDEVLLAVAKRWPAAAVTNNNEADALILACMGARAHGRPVDDPPKAHVEAMTKAAWPIRAGVA